MSTTTDTWTEAEIGAVRQTLADGRDRLRIGPTPWDRLTARRRAVTLQRRALTASLAVAVSVAVVAGLAARGGHTSAPVQPDRPVNGTYGTLAGDTAFVRALRETAPGFGEYDRRPTAAAVQVLVATETDGVRLALLRTTAPRDRGTRWWAEGLPGAPAALLTVSHNCLDEQVCWTPYGSQVRPAPGRATGEGVVVAAPAGSRVRVVGAADVLPDGTLRRRVTAVPERWPGVYVVAGPSGRTRLDLEVQLPGAAEPWRDALPGRGPDTSFPRPGPASRGNGLGESRGIGAPPADGAFQLEAATNAAAVAPAEEPRTLLTAHAGESRWAVFAFRGRSGGWAAVAARQGRPGDPMSTAVQAVMPRPSGDPERLALAWPDPWSGAGAVSLLGPTGSDRAELTTPRGTVGVRLADGFGTVVAPGATGVRFLDAAGREVGRTTVAPAYRGIYDGS